MSDFIQINANREFELKGKRFLLNCAVYFGRQPGSCGGLWLSDPHWDLNRKYLEPDFTMMEKLGLNSIGLFVRSEDFIHDGKLTRRIERLDEVLNRAWQHNLRIIIFPGPFINNPTIYRQMTGRPAPKDFVCWTATYHAALFDAYVYVMSFLAKRYRREPGVLGYMDRIDRFVPNFGRRDKIPGLERVWQTWLEKRYQTFAAFQKVHGNLREKPASFAEVKMPQDFPDGFSLRDSRAYEYALMQRVLVGETQGRFDAEIKKLAPKQIVWTPFEGVSLMNPILDGYLHTPKTLEAIWTEYYPATGFGSSYRVHLPQADADFLILPDVEVARMPAYSAGAYLFTRWLKTTAQAPVVLCHGWQMETERRDSRWEYEYQTLVDKTNRAVLEADADGWAYWCWSDDATSLTATMDEQGRHRDHYRHRGETMGLMRWDNTLRPAALTVRDYSRLLQSRPAPQPRTPKEALLLLPEPKMLIEEEALTLQTATGVMAALLRSGVLPEVRWTATTRRVIRLRDLQPFKLVVLGDSTYERDRPTVPEVLEQYVRAGGVLFWPVHTTEWIEDEYGRRQEMPHLRTLAATRQPPFKIQPLGEIQWFVHSGFEHIVSPLTGLHRCMIESQVFTWLKPDIQGLEIIASAKLPKDVDYDRTQHFGYQMDKLMSQTDGGGTRVPLFYRFRLGKGTVYVFTWSFNVFRDDGTRMLYGGSEWDWMLRLPLESASIVPNLTMSLGAELRDAAFDCITTIRRKS